MPTFITESDNHSHEKFLLMRFSTISILLNAITHSYGKSHKITGSEEGPVLGTNISTMNHREGGKESLGKTTVEQDPVEGVSDWAQKTDGDRADWKKYANRPGNNGKSSGGQFDWMQYGAPHMNSLGGNKVDSEPGAPIEGKATANWNNGQGDGYGEPIRSQTGGDFRYKFGREWNNNTLGGWQQFAAPYNSVNPQQPGEGASSVDQGGKDWQEYMGGNQAGGGGDHSKYMEGSQGNGDWSKYIPGNKATGSTPGPATSGGYFEIEVSGKNLNVSTNFGLGQGRGGNSPDASANDSTSTGGGGGGGNQNTITAKEGRIFIQGQFLSQLDRVVPAN